jgi:hypothetical protein
LEREKSIQIQAELEALREWKKASEVEIKTTRNSEIEALRESSESKGKYEREKQRADDAVRMR